MDASYFSGRPPGLASRIGAMVRTLGTLVVDPSRLDLVLVFTQAVNISTVARAVRRLERDRAGAALLAEQPRIDRSHVDFDALRRLPDGTLGREYTRFLDDNGISPDAFAAIPDVGDPRAAYLMLRMRQTHDLWHVLTGYAPDIRGEILLQAFTYAQTGAPASLLIAVFGSARWGFGWRGQMAAMRKAFARGKRAHFLALVRWEEHWATPVEELRTKLECPHGG
jgi:ubiquinone biosynthesis protein COQ4